MLVVRIAQACQECSSTAAEELAHVVVSQVSSCLSFVHCPCCVHRVLFMLQNVSTGRLYGFLLVLILGGEEFCNFGQPTGLITCANHGNNIISGKALHAKCELVL